MRENLTVRMDIENVIVGIKILGEEGGSRLRRGASATLKAKLSGFGLKYHGSQLGG